MKVQEIAGLAFDTPKRIEIATTILEALRKSTTHSNGETGLYSKDISKLSKDLAAKKIVSRPPFYEVLERLLDLGMVQRDGMWYRLSPNFSNALRRLMKSWLKISKSSKASV